MQEDIRLRTAQAEEVQAEGLSDRAAVSEEKTFEHESFEKEVAEESAFDFKAEIEEEEIIEPREKEAEIPPAGEEKVPQIFVHFFLHRRRAALLQRLHNLPAALLRHMIILGPGNADRPQMNALFSPSPAAQTRGAWYYHKRTAGPGPLAARKHLA